MQKRYFLAVIVVNKYKTMYNDTDININKEDMSYANCNISDSYNYGFWTIQFDNIIDMNSGKNILN